MLLQVAGSEGKAPSSLTPTAKHDFLAKAADFGRDSALRCLALACRSMSAGTQEVWIPSPPSGSFEAIRHTGCRLSSACHFQVPKSFINSVSVTGFYHPASSSISRGHRLSIASGRTVEAENCPAMGKTGRGEIGGPDSSLQLAGFRV